MNVFMLISSGEPEVLWNAFRFANLMLNENEEVTIFLNGPAVDYQAADSEQFPVALLAKTFALSEGTLLA